jgi:hypothetical protein
MKLEENVDGRAKLTLSLFKTRTNREVKSVRNKSCFKFHWNSNESTINSHQFSVLKHVRLFKTGELVHGEKDMKFVPFVDMNELLNKIGNLRIEIKTKVFLDPEKTRLKASHNLTTVKSRQAKNVGKRS